MPVALDHIIVPAHDKHASATFLADILGIPASPRWGPFVSLPLSNGVTLDFMDSERFEAQHCAFLMSDAEFDASFARIRDLGLRYWADPFRQQPGEINHRLGGRGVYFLDPSGHAMELLTRSG